MKFKCANLMKLKGAEVFLHFVSDDTISGKGFSLTWGNSCGGNLVADKTVQSFSSSNYPQPYQELLIYSN